MEIVGCKKLFFIHCGFYDEELSNGIYEFHLNIAVVADSVESAKLEVRKKDMFRKKKMHIDGIQELTVVDGHQILLVADSAADTTIIQDHLHRDF